jgi:hypothetical protein
MPATSSVPCRPRRIKTVSLGLRLVPPVHDALKQAAGDDGHSVAALAEMILLDWLRAKGNLPNGVQ